MYEQLVPEIPNIVYATMSLILLVENKLYIVKLIGTLSIKYLLMYYQELIMGLDITRGVSKCLKWFRKRRRGV